MKPLAHLPKAVRADIRGVLTDIDDTLSTHGKIDSVAYRALEDLRAAGKLVIPITGRPAGWCDHIARMWPVDAVVGENGAFYMRYNQATHKLQARFVAGAEERAANRARLAHIGAGILRDVPGCALASDQNYRESDLAIDFCEDVPPLPSAQVERIVALMHAAGMTARISSIHVNGWFGDYDKLGMTRTLLAEAFDIDLDAQRERFVFVGDSPNDAPMFAYFPHSIGVANVRAWLDRIPTPPTYITPSAGGAGFAEVAAVLGAQPKVAT